MLFRRGEYMENKYKLNTNQTVYDMNLNPGPFGSIRSGLKTVEMRLNDERRVGIEKGDLIRFTNVETGKILLVRVLEKSVYPSFKELYDSYSKTSIGYKENEDADSMDMLTYYSKESIAKYGALALGIELI